MFPTGVYSDLALDEQWVEGQRKILADQEAIVSETTKTGSMLADLWRHVGTRQVVSPASRRGFGKAGFIARAEVYQWVGDEEAIPNGERIGQPAYGVVVHIEQKTDGYHCMQHVADAVRKAHSSLQFCRIASVKHHSLDWGAPIFRPDRGDSGTGEPGPNEVIIFV